MKIKNTSLSLAALVLSGVLSGISVENLYAVEGKESRVHNKKDIRNLSVSQEEVKKPTVLKDDTHSTIVKTADNTKIIINKKDGEIVLNNPSGVREIMAMLKGINYGYYDVEVVPSNEYPSYSQEAYLRDNSFSFESPRPVKQQPLILIVRGVSGENLQFLARYVKTERFEEETRKIK